MPWDSAHVLRFRADDWARRRARLGFTIVELLVVVGIIAVLIGLLIPVLGIARQRAHTTTCLANLRQIGMAISSYANDNRNKIVPADVMPPDPYKATMRMGNWATILVSGGYLAAPDASASTGDPSRSVLHCPDGQNFDAVLASAYNSPRQSALQSG